MRYALWLVIIGFGLFMTCTTKPVVTVNVFVGIALILVGMIGALLQSILPKINFKYSLRCYVMVSCSLICFGLSGLSFYFFAVDDEKDSVQGFLGIGGNLAFCILAWVMAAVSVRQLSIDTGEYIPPDQIRKMEQQKLKNILAQQKTEHL